MPIKHSYNDIFNALKEYNCELLCCEPSFNEIYQNVYTKLNIIASCGHTYFISYHSFNKRKHNIVCKNCNYSKLSEIQTLNLSNQKNKNCQLERNTIDFVKNLISSFFDLKKTFEGCKADVAIKPSTINDDKWLGVQFKSTHKKVVKKNNVGYNFSISKNYENMIIICVAYEDEKIWIFENDEVKHIKSVLTIRDNSKYNKFEVNHLNLINILFDKYKKYNNYMFNELDTPISDSVKLEYKYRNLRIKKIDFINFIENDVQGEVFDFKINEKKVQEKVSSISKKSQSYTFNLFKCDGKKNKKRKRQPYFLGDCDFYWLNCNDTSYFYVIPENILLEKGYIGNPNGKLKSLFVSNTNKTTFWMKEYLFDYDNLDKTKLCKFLL